VPKSAWKGELESAVRPAGVWDLARREIGRGKLRGRSWRKVAPGFYVPQTAGWRIETPGEDGPQLCTGQRILDATALLAADSALGGWAAAYVLGGDWLDGLDPYTMKDLPLDIAAPSLKRRSTSTITYRYSQLTTTDVWVRDGIRVTAPRRTTFDGARWARSLEEAVVFIDTMAAFGLIRIADITAYASQHSGWLGVGQVLDACRIARAGVKSGWETRLRMCWTRDLGLPEPLVNVPIFNAAGEHLGTADLFDPESGLVGEYDGHQHREIRQHHSDNIREEKFEAANLVVVRSDTIDLREQRAQLGRRLQDGYRRGQRRDRRRDDWTLEQPRWWRDRFR